MSKNYKNPARYRLDFIKENTFNRIWSIRMTRARVVAMSIAVVAGTVALLWCIMVFTPIRRLLPGALSGDLRNQYLETALRLDSLEQSATSNSAYLANLVAIMKGDIEADSIVLPTEFAVTNTDSLLAASDLERQFVRQYEEEERFNLSVLAPIAADGMVFGSPVSTSTSVETDPSSPLGVTITSTRNAAASAIYRGAILAAYADPSTGTSTVIVQHPNDFISIYSGLADIFIAKGRKVAAGQRIGQAGTNGTFGFELWHNGTPLDPRGYISF